MTFILLDGISSLTAWVVGRLQELIRDETAKKRLDQIEAQLEALTVNDILDVLTGLSWAEVEGTATNLLSGMIAIILAFILFAYVLDFLVRLLRFAAPIVAEADERLLMQHASLNQAFDEAGRVSGNLVKPERRYYRWLNIRIQLESSKENGTYFIVRRRLEEAATLNERMFSYITPYTIISVFALLWASPGNSLGLAAILSVLGAGFLLLKRQFRLSRDIVKNDLETYVAKEGGDIDPAEMPEGDAEWRRVFPLKPWAQTAIDRAKLLYGDTSRH